MLIFTKRDGIGRFMFLFANNSERITSYIGEESHVTQNIKSAADPCACTQCCDIFRIRAFAGCVCAGAFFLGLLPFSGLVGVIYTILGYVGLLFGGCVIIKSLRGKPGKKTGDREQVDFRE